jgi:hypothetical protein
MVKWCPPRANKVQGSRKQTYIQDITSPSSLGVACGAQMPTKIDCLWDKKLRQAELMALQPCRMIGNDQMLRKANLNKWEGRSFINWIGWCKRCCTVHTFIQQQKIAIQIKATLQHSQYLLKASIFQCINSLKQENGNTTMYVKTLPIWLMNRLHINNNPDPIHILPRGAQTAIFWLWTRPCRPRSHLYRLGIAYTDECACGGGAQTLEHLLQYCITHTELRQQTWPLEQTVEGKLKDLEKTAGFVLASGERL